MSTVVPAADRTADTEHLALLPRPEPGPEVMAAIAAAAQLVWPQPIPMRRARPWARP